MGETGLIIALRLLVCILFVAAFISILWHSIERHEAVHMLAYRYDGCHNITTEVHFKLHPFGIMGTAQCTDQNYAPSAEANQNQLLNEIISYNLQSILSLVFIGFFFLIGINILRE